MPRNYVRKRQKMSWRTSYSNFKHKQALSSVNGRNERLYSEHEILTTCFNYFLNEILSLYERTTVNTVVIDGIEITRRGKNRVYEVIEEYRRQFWYKYYKLTERQISVEVSRILRLVAQIVVQTSVSEKKEKVNQLVKQWLVSLDNKFGWKVAEHKYINYQDLIGISSRPSEEEPIYKQPTVIGKEPVVEQPTMNEPPQPYPKDYGLKRILLARFIRLFENLKILANGREYQRYDYQRRLTYLITTALLFSASVVGLIIFYSNALKLNEIHLLIIKLGGVLILLSLFFALKFGWRLLKEVDNIFKRQRNWIKFLIIIFAFILLWQGYAHKYTALNPVFEFYNKTNFLLFSPVSMNNLTLENKNFSLNSSWFSNISSFFTGPKIDNDWVHNFISIVNDERRTKGLVSLQESGQLDNIAQVRFNKMMENPMISHYGAGAYNTGEVVLYPKDSTEQEYANKLRQDAPLHWDLLTDPSFSAYGFHIEDGPTIEITGTCQTTEIPGPNIDAEKFFKQLGCQTSMGTSVWLVIDMT